MADIMHNEIKDIIRNSIETQNKVLNNDELIEKIQQSADAIVAAYAEKKKVLFCGNGGSAADAQHLSAELTGRFYFDREPLFSEALHTNTSYLTAVANDYSYDEVYSRLVRGIGSKGDILVALSTSGNSANLIRALETANKMGLVTVGMTGSTGGKMKEHCKILINVPSDDTPRVQEAHGLIGHIICELVEKKLFKK
jgi:D-sedoheptulose 7-phosphate isomerase